MKLLSRNSLIAIVIVSLVAGFVWKTMFSSRASAGRSSYGKVRFGKVKRGDLVQRVTVSGQIQPIRRTVFVPPFAGYIQKIFVTVGQKVNRNDPIVSVSPTLQASDVVFPIRAPFAGTVVDVKKMEGEYVADSASNIIVRVDDLSKYFVRAKAPELDATRIKKEMEVEVRVSAIQGPALKGVVRNLTLAAEEADGWRAQQSTFEVSVEILDPPAALRSGQSAILDIVTNRFEDVIYLEHEFINREGEQNFVVTRSGKRKNIKIGRQSDLAVEVIEGLKEGEEVEQIDFLKLLESST